jgi:glycosyltransferase involved in cell wall biosynthesis
VTALLDEADLLVMPSLWPEPFGLSGPEAGLQGVPAAAFAVGGIPQWLEDGVNGHLAPGNPPSAPGLADAIVRCLADPFTHSRLRQGALESARRWSAERHVAELLPILTAASR